ncbi:unnamed protein product [Amoebophrya sp. A120]|nr:unnamed protein product [Amoebophrya sp. A120]|eukprot:GSA120T00012973001.1
MLPFTAPVLLGALALTITLLIVIPRLCAARFYDFLIIRMTRVWYKEVLSRVNDGDHVLDIGVGTATALLRNKELLEKKKLQVFGVDYDQAYIDLGKQQLLATKTSNQVQLTCRSIYDVAGVLSDFAASSGCKSGDQHDSGTKKNTGSSIASSPGMNKKVIMKDQVDASPALSSPSTAAPDGETLEQDYDEYKNKFDAAYFSGSFTLLPDPVAALHLARDAFVKKNGRIFITQTFQKQRSPMTALLKPLLKYVTTIDFGTLTYESDLENILEKAGLPILYNEPIPNSIDTRFQVAKIICLDCGDRTGKGAGAARG